MEGVEKFATEHDGDVPGPSTTKIAAVATEMASPNTKTLHASANTTYQRNRRGCVVTVGVEGDLDMGGGWIGW